MENIKVRGLFPIKVETSYRCPKCNQTDSFEVEVETVVVYEIGGDGDIMDEHTYDGGEWGDMDRMSCSDCGHAQRVKHFRKETIIMSGLPMVTER